MHPRALAAPLGPVTPLSQALIEEAIQQSRQSPRGRIILPFHPSADDLLQRMLNAMQPGSYVRPHRHLDPPKAESIVMLPGRIRAPEEGTPEAAPYLERLVRLVA